jgi:hypothetical protein
MTNNSVVPRRLLDPTKAPRYIGAQVIIDSETMLRASPEQMDEIVEIKVKMLGLTLRHQISGWLDRWTEAGKQEPA